MKKLIPEYLEYLNRDCVALGGLKPTPVKYVDKFTVWASQCTTSDHPRPAVMTYALLCTVMTYATANSLFGRCNALLQHLPAKRPQKHGSDDGLDKWLKSKKKHQYGMEIVIVMTVLARTRAMTLMVECFA